MTFEEANYRESDKIGRLWEADIEIDGELIAQYVITPLNELKCIPLVIGTDMMLLNYFWKAEYKRLLKLGLLEPLDEHYDVYLGGKKINIF